MFKIDKIEEPTLVFGNNYNGINPYTGIIEYGPYQLPNRKEIETKFIIENRLRGYIDNLWNRVVNAHSSTSYRGFNGTFRIPLRPLTNEIDNYSCYVNNNDIQAIKDEIYRISLGEKPAIICIVASDELLNNHYYELKLFSIINRVRVQLIRESTLSSKGIEYIAINIAINLATAIFTKANGIPWQLTKPLIPNGIILGIAFTQDISNKSLYYGVIEIFDNYGRFLDIKAEAFKISNRLTKGLFVPSDKLSKILSELKERYQQDIIIVHKSAPFVDEEIKTFNSIFPKNVLIHIERINLYRCYDPNSNDYTPDRGTYLQDSTNSNRCILLTTGNIRIDKGIKGHKLGTPKPLEINVVNNAIGLNNREIIEQILALTKIDWNTIEMEIREPVTLKYSKIAARLARIDKLQNMPRLSLDIRDLM